MGDDVDLPPINEVAAFLDRYSKPAAQALAARRPELAGLLRIGIKGGDADQVPEAIARSGLDARAQVLSEALKEAIDKAELASANLQRKLVELRRIRFAAAALAALAASSVIGAAFVGRAATLVAGAVALGANLLGLAADVLVLGPGRKEPAVSDLVRTLSQLVGKCILSQKLLNALRQSSYAVDDMKSTLIDGNVLFSNLNDALAEAATFQAIKST